METICIYKITEVVKPKPKAIEKSTCVNKANNEKVTLLYFKYQWTLTTIIVIRNGKIVWKLGSPAHYMFIILEFSNKPKYQGLF